MVEQTYRNTTEAMPDCRASDLFNALAVAYKVNYILPTAMLMTMTASMLGLRAVIYRSQAAAGTDIPFFNRTFSSPDFYVLQDDNRAISFWLSASSLTATKEAAAAAKYKNLTKAALQNAGLLTPIGAAVKGYDASILSQLENAGVTRFVVKPLHASTTSNHIGVDLNLDEARVYLESHAEEEVIVEEYIEGNELRAYVMDGKIICVSRCDPPHLVGDGRHSVLDLLRIRHEKMSRNPAQCVDYGSYAPDAFMKIARARNWNINAVLPAGKALLLHNTKTRTVHDRIEITNRLPNRMKDQIIKASTCTGLRFAAVDAIVTPNGKVFILEVNAKPGFAPHSFPLDDQWNLHIPEAIIRWHFPELRDPIRRVRNYDFVGLLRDFQKQPDRDRFNVADYIALE